MAAESSDRDPRGCSAGAGAGLRVAPSGGDEFGQQVRPSSGPLQQRHQPDGRCDFPDRLSVKLFQPASQRARSSAASVSRPRCRALMAVMAFAGLLSVNDQHVLRAEGLSRS
jgi:hypothetical protein